MNPLVCQPNDGPPTKEIQISLCPFQQKHIITKRSGSLPEHVFGVFS